MAEDVEDRLRAAQTRLSQEHAAKARAEVEQENAQKIIAEVKSELKESYGVVTGAELKEVRTNLDSELEAAVAEVESKLETASA